MSTLLEQIGALRRVLDEQPARAPHTVYIPAGLRKTCEADPEFVPFAKPEPMDDGIEAIGRLGGALIVASVR